MNGARQGIRGEYIISCLFERLKLWKLLWNLWNPCEVQFTAIHQNTTTFQKIIIIPGLKMHT
jgi:hypothetical protein